jgi:hypothetical protein
MGKINKLKEINKKISRILNDLETDIFIKNIDIENNRIIKKYNQTLINSK